MPLARPRECLTTKAHLSKFKGQTGVTNDSRLTSQVESLLQQKGAQGAVGGRRRGACASGHLLEPTGGSVGGELAGAGQEAQRCRLKVTVLAEARCK